jgi:hypothetical protein
MVFRRDKAQPHNSANPRRYGQSQEISVCTRVCGDDVDSPTINGIAVKKILDACVVFVTLSLQNLVSAHSTPFRLSNISLEDGRYRRASVGGWRTARRGTVRP